MGTRKRELTSLNRDFVAEATLRFCKNDGPESSTDAQEDAGDAQNLTLTPLAAQDCPHPAGTFRFLGAGFAESRLTPASFPFVAVFQIELSSMKPDVLQVVSASIALVHIATIAKACCMLQFGL